MSAESSSDWPIDPDGEDGSEGMRKYDMAVLSKIVGEEDAFPATRTELIEEYGEYPVRINYEELTSVEEILDDVDTEEFETKQEFHRAVGRTFRREGVWEHAPDPR